MSYQSTGWNDCPPILDIAPNGPRRKRNASRTQHNTLNNGFMNNAKENNATGDAAAAQTNESTGKWNSTCNSWKSKLASAKGKSVQFIILTSPYRWHTREFWQVGEDSKQVKWQRIQPLRQEVEGKSSGRIREQRVQEYHSQRYQWHSCSAKPQWSQITFDQLYVGESWGG